MCSQLHQGFRLYPEQLDRAAQKALLADVMEGVAANPFYRPTMPRTGRPMSVLMTNFGSLGWVSDQQGGYRYQAAHPVTGKLWPAIPEALLDIWRTISDYPLLPEACLVNYYEEGAKMGLHVDADERDRNAPVVSISLGDTAIFRLGAAQRGGKTQSFRLASGDVMVLGGPARDFYHGIDRVLSGTSTLVEGGGRINITMRVVG